MNPWSLAKAEARRSICRFRHGAVIVKGDMVASGRNANPTPSGSIHAELMAIMNFINKWGIAELKGASIYVVRINKQGILRMSRPCTNCMTFITFFELKEVHYVNLEGGYSHETM